MMSKEKRRVPKLRFPGFTEDWEQRKLGEFVKIISGDAPSTFISGSCIYVKVDDLNYSDRIQLSSSNLVNINPKAHLVNKGATIFPKRGAAIMTNKVRIMGKDGYLDTNMMALIPEEIDKNFLFTFIQKTGLYKIADTSTIPQINNKHIEPYMIQVPNDKEQECVGVVFEKIDKIITLHQRKLDNLKLKKKALLQKLFPKNGERYPELRFPGFTDAWEQRKLESLFTKYEDKVNTPNSGYWRLGLRSHCKGTFHTYIDAGNELETAEMNRVKSGNFILNITFAWERALAVTNDEDQDKLVSHRFPQFKPNSDLVIDFFKHTLMDKRFKHHLELSSPGGAGRNKVLKVADMLKYELLVPSIKEQNEISSFLNHVDYIITLHQRKLDHLQLQKKALLQQMFV